jgi:N-methylation
MKRGFTMLELVFVIVILGILAGIAAPRLFATRDDAVIAKARADLASIRSGIVNAYNANMLTGNFTYPVLSSSSGLLFDNVLRDGIKANSQQGWSGTGNTYSFNYKGASTTFTYDIANGTFTCPNNNSDKLCKQLTE